MTYAAEITARAACAPALAPVAQSSSLLCTEHAGCLELAVWKIVRRGRGWTGRACCEAHKP